MDGNLASAKTKQRAQFLFITVTSLLRSYFVIVQVWEKHNTQKFHQFVPFWSTNTMNSIGGFILNLVRIHFKFDKQGCSDVLNNTDR